MVANEPHELIYLALLTMSESTNKTPLGNALRFQTFSISIFSGDAELAIASVLRPLYRRREQALVINFSVYTHTHNFVCVCVCGSTVGCFIHQLTATSTGCMEMCVTLRWDGGGEMFAFLNLRQNNVFDILSPKRRICTILLTQIYRGGDPQLNKAKL